MHLHRVSEILKAEREFLEISIAHPRIVVIIGELVISGKKRKGVRAGKAGLFNVLQNSYSKVFLFARNPRPSPDAS